MQCPHNYIVTNSLTTGERISLSAGIDLTRQKRSNLCITENDLCLSKDHSTIKVKSKQTLAKTLEEVKNEQ